MRIFCIANQKGGVGKTTTTVNLAAGLARLGKRVLLVDLDPQGNATMGSGIDKRALDPSIYDVLLEGASIAETRRQRPEGLRRAGRQPRTGRRRGRTGQAGTPRKAPEGAPSGRDHRVRLRAGRLPAFVEHAHAQRPVCAHGVIVPMQCEYFALEGLSDLVNTIKQVHANLNPELEIIGLLRVMFDPRITLQQQVSEQLKAHFGDKVFNTVIPRNVRLAEAPSYGQPGVTFDPSSKGAQAFVEFAKEMALRLG
jgi:chromosome partitioning protein